MIIIIPNYKTGQALIWQTKVNTFKVKYIIIIYNKAIESIILAYWLILQ